MGKLLSLFAFILLLTGSLSADNAKEDSLLSLVPRAQSRKRIDIYLELSALKITNSSADKAAGYAKTALDIANDINSPLLKAKSLEAYSLAAYFQAQYPLSIELLKNAYQLYKSQNNSVGMANSLNRLGNCYDRLGNYLEALAAYQKSLTIEQEIGDRANVAKVMNNLGIVYRNLKDYSHALTLFQKSREIAIQLEDSLGITSTQNNLGTILLDLGRYDEALPIFLHVLELHKRQGNKYGVINAYDNLGLTHLRLGNLEKAVAYYFQGAQMAHNLNEKYQEAQGLNNLGTVLSKQGKLSEALKYAQQANTIAKKHSIRQIELETMLTLAEIKHKEGADNKSRIYLLQYIRLKDSVFTQGLSEKAAEFQVKYDVKSQNQANEILNQELNLTQIKTVKSEGVIFLLLFGAAITTTLLIILLWIYRKLRKKTRKIASMNEELNRFNHNLEETIERRTLELSHALNKAEESDRLKTAFLTNMSHEIRTPLNGIIGFSKMLEDDLPREIRKQYMEIIDERGQHLLQIINDIINIAKIESGQLTIRKSTCQVNNLLNLLLLEYQQTIASKANDQLHLITSKSFADTDSTIITDGTRLQEVIGNLLDNAIKFTEEGTIEFGYKPISNDKELLFWVKDTGYGVPIENHARIFERFNQVSPPHGESSGTGLGLAISKGLVELLGGTIWVEGNNGRGCTFFFTIPLVKLQPNGINPAEPLLPLQHVLTGKTILVVEDDFISFQYLESILRDVNAALIHVKNGEDAVEVCQMNTKIDLVLMDIQLPFMDGCETTRKIKIFRKNLPIIAQTADVMPEDKIRCFESGCDDFIGKPIDPDELVSIIAKRIL
ncbi:tetratricopeptide repeat protein [Williamwhitmania taraxaci]|uniref:histidine kinase n=1 Tax=Williamwhitmania taraxaci TaxID=1640674 RepID=A0A1G6LWU6_9BACT|nr:tetratricopeptide repeat protein [Williamwhitmania taraxaci]SDC47689.1 Signal transduction histidine kinase [Williamwhitmania taraxaci]